MASSGESKRVRKKGEPKRRKVAKATTEARPPRSRKKKAPAAAAPLEAAPITTPLEAAPGDSVPPPAVRPDSLSPVVSPAIELPTPTAWDVAESSFFDSVPAPSDLAAPAPRRGRGFTRYVAAAFSIGLVLGAVAFFGARAVRRPPAVVATAAKAPVPALTAEAAEAVANEATLPAEALADDLSPDHALADREKRASQAALERGDVPGSIEAGEQSVAHDPSDAESWLILGAAYQAKGDFANMRRAFHSCLEQGKGYWRNECGLFPH